MLSTDVQLSARGDQVPPEHQDQDLKQPPEPPPVKEEQEKLEGNCRLEGKQPHGLEELNIIEFTFSVAPVKTEDDDDEPPTLKLHQAEQAETGAAGSEPVRKFSPEHQLEPETREFRSGFRHLQSHEERYTATTSATSCTFRNGERLQDRHGNQSAVKRFGCSGCGKSFTDRNDWESHFCCYFCRKTFSSNLDLSAHLELHSEEKPFACSVCSKAFKKRSNLTAHFRVHTGEKPFSCPMCDKSFTHRQHMQTHISIHTGEKPFSCSICGKTFREKMYMRRHMKVHGEKKFSCSFCGERFTLLAYLKKHKCFGVNGRRNRRWSLNRRQAFPGLAAGLEET